jgi:peptidoglycan hydrolase-like protein with peptidoglycan-binding domain
MPTQLKVAIVGDSFQSAAPTPSAARRAALQRGMTGGLVRELQRHLVAEGDLRSADVATGPGVFGPRTEHAVRAFQEREGLPVTGMVGPQTWAALLGDGFSPPRSETTVTEQPRTLDLSQTRPLEAGFPSISNTRSAAVATVATRPPGARVNF